MTPVSGRFGPGYRLAVILGVPDQQSVRDGEVVRHRLLDRLAARWRAPLTVMVAPAGFGKSVAIRQVVEANLAAPRGSDHVVVCRRSDRDATHLAERLLAALGVAVAEVVDDPAAAAAVVGAALGARSPHHACLIVDDVHELDDGSGAAALLAALVAELPANGHLFLSGRDVPASVPTARYRAAGTLVALDADDMAFDVDELAIAGVTAGVHNNLGGWPALVRLSLIAGRSASLEFLRQEVLDALPEPVRLDLAVAVLAGAADDHLLHHLGAGTGAAELARRVPLVEIDADGRAVPHALWRDIADQIVPGPDQADLVTLVAGWFRATGRPDDALEVLAAARSWDEAASLAREVLATSGVLMRRAEARRWCDAFPEGERERPEVLVLRGIVARLTVGDRRDPSGRSDDIFVDVDDDRARPDEPHDVLLTRAAQGFVRAGHPDGIGVTLLLRLWSAIDRGAVATVAELRDEAVEVEARWPGCLGATARVTDGIGAWFEGDPDAGLATLDAVVAGVLPDAVRAFVELQRAALCLQVGEGAAAVAASLAARRASVAAIGVETVSQHVLVAWSAGDPGPALAVFTGSRQVVAASPQDRFRAVVYVNLIGASMGLAPPVDVDSVTAQGTGTGRDVALVGLVAAVVDASLGDDSAATARLRMTFDRIDLDDPVMAGDLRRALVPIYVLLPEVRESIDRASLGPLHVATRALARLLVALRSGEPVSWNDLPTPAVVVTAMPLPWTIDVAAAAHGAGHHAGREIVDLLLDAVGDVARRRLRVVADGGGPWAAAAQALLAAVPAPPDELVHIRALGGIEVGHGDAPRQVPARRRVRELLALLALRGEVTREVAMATLWPGLDPPRARNNLNVTVRHLRSVLEPHRRAGEAPYVLRTTGSTVRLVTSPQVRVDLWEARRALDAARTHEADRDLAAATESCRAALDLWTGEVVADLAYVDEIAAERDSLTASLLDAGCRGAELALARHDGTLARDLAERVLARDALSERAHRVLIAAAVADDDDIGARTALARAEAAAREMGVPLAPETRSLTLDIGRPR